MTTQIPYAHKINPWSSHGRIASLLEGLPAGSRVLDVGAASGMLARSCAGHGYQLRAIEPNSHWISDNQALYTGIYLGRLEQTPDSFLQGHAAVVCGDVLEHLVDPGEQLARLVKLQPTGCIFIVSVPNVANLWVRLSLLLGKFDYSDRGILDHTHLHFYTRKSFSNLLHHAGLEITGMFVTPIPLELVLPFFTGNLLGRTIYHINALFTQWLPTLLGYQFVAKAHKVK